MKKLLMIIGLVAGAATVSTAQGVAFGLKGGVNLSQVRGDGNGSDQGFWEADAARTTGFTAGAFARFGNKVYLQPEFMISQKGGKTTGLLGIERDFKQTYFDVPVLVGIRLADVIRVNAGPVATFLVNEDQSFLDNIGITDSEEGFRKAILGYQAGIGFDIGKINLDMRYEGNVNDVFNIDYDNSQTQSQFAGKGNAWMVTAGFTF